MDLNLSNSIKFAEKNEALIPGFTLSMMKKPDQFAPGKFPMFIKSGKGAIVTDVDGNEYIDFICGLAANTLGHGHPAVTTTIQKALEDGILHSLPTPSESKAAESVAKVIPHCEMVRFFKTGADANSAAIRLARAYTGREKIITVGYNGFHDHFMFDTPGVPEALKSLTHRMPLFTPNDEEPLLNLIENDGKKKFAALLLAVPYNRVLERSFVTRLKEVCSANGTLLILDEVMTGFRLALGGAQEFFGVEADLVTLSKGIAAGMPLSAVCGRRTIMKIMETLQVSSTFAGETLSLEVCNSVINEYQKSDYIENIYSMGRRLKHEINLYSQTKDFPLKVVGYDPIPMFLFSKNPQEHVKLAEPFLGEMAKRGVIMRREVNFISGAHTMKQIETTVEACKEALQSMKQNNLF